MPGAASAIGAEAAVAVDDCAATFGSVLPCVAFEIGSTPVMAATAVRLAMITATAAVATSGCMRRDCGTWPGEAPAYC